jgi:hypothetical protein
MAKKKAKDEEPEGDEETTDDGHVPVRLADHPRASRSIAGVRSWAAVIGFSVAAYFSYKAGLPFVDLVIRSILIGMATSLVCWAGAQAVWKQIVFAEIATARKEAAEKQKELIEALEQAKEQQPPQR